MINVSNVLKLQETVEETPAEMKKSKVSIAVCHKSKKSYFACFVK